MFVELKICMFVDAVDCIVSLSLSLKGEIHFQVQLETSQKSRCHGCLLKTPKPVELF